MENGVLIKPLSEKANNFFQLASDFVVVVFKPLTGVVGVVEFYLEDVCALANPERVDDAEFVSYIVDELVLGLTCTGVVHGFVIRVGGCRIAGPLALRPMCGALAMIDVVVIVVGDVGEFAAKGLIFLAECVLPSLMLSGNLQNAIT